MILFKYLYNANRVYRFDAINYFYRNGENYSKIHVDPYRIPPKLKQS